MINEVFRRLNHRYVVKTVTLHGRLNACNLLLSLHNLFRLHSLRTVAYSWDVQAKLMWRLQLQIFHGIIKGLKLFIHRLVDLTHLNLDVCLIYLLSFNAVVFFCSRCFFCTVIANLIQTCLLSSLGGDTGVQLVLKLLFETIVADDCINVGSKRLYTLDWKI